MLKHVVLFKFEPEADPQKIAELETHLADLPRKIPEIKGYQFGHDVVHSERSHDFALVSTFDDLAAMKRYQTHPDHLVVLELVKALCEDIRAVDFEV